MRKALDRIYLAAGALSAICILTICVLVTMQVIFNLITKLMGHAVRLYHSILRRFCRVSSGWRFIFGVGLYTQARWTYPRDIVPRLFERSLGARC